MRLVAIQAYLKQRGICFSYEEEADSGTIDFLYRGLSYHIWEFPAPDRGAESNVRCAGRMEEFEGDYEVQILNILQSWQA